MVARSGEESDKIRVPMDSDKLVLIVDQLQKDYATFRNPAPKLGHTVHQIYCAQRIQRWYRAHKADQKRVKSGRPAFISSWPSSPSRSAPAVARSPSAIEIPSPAALRAPDAGRQDPGPGLGRPAAARLPSVRRAVSTDAESQRGRVEGFLQLNRLPSGDPARPAFKPSVERRGSSRSPSPAVERRGSSRSRSPSPGRKASQYDDLPGQPSPGPPSPAAQRSGSRLSLSPGAGAGASWLTPAERADLRRQRDLAVAHVALANTEKRTGLQSR
jgi:hypothetical protein